MSQWWYEVNGKAKGPVEEVEFMRLLRVGSINFKTMIWQEGMASWLPAEDVVALAKLKTTIPPPIPSRQATSQNSQPLEDNPTPTSKVGFSKYTIAGRWPRFFARIFDVWWETILIGFVWGFTSSLTPLLPIPSNEILISIICIPFAMVLDALIYSVFGNTPGKALLGIKVLTHDGDNLSLANYLNRNIYVWVCGFACGVPIIGLATYIYQSSRLNRGDRASYDVKESYNVVLANVGYFSKIAFCICFIILIFVIGLFSIVSKEYSSKQVNNVATSQLHNIGTQQPQSLAHEATIAPPATQSPAPITKPTDNSNHFGRVQETMNSSGYTYVLIDEGSQNTWVAVMETKVKVGDIIEFPDSEPMLNFQSKSLNKTFDKIIFAPSLLIHSSKTAGAKTITRNNEYSEKNNTNNNNTKSNNAHAQKIDFKIGTLRTGYIIQIATGDGYTYLDVNTTDEYMGSTWIACNNASLKVGSNIKFRHSKIYNNVNSKDIPNVVFNKIMYTSCEKDKE